MDVASIAQLTSHGVDIARCDNMWRRAQTARALLTRSTAVGNEQRTRRWRYRQLILNNRGDHVVSLAAESCGVRITYNGGLLVPGWRARGRTLWRGADWCHPTALGHPAPRTTPASHL